MRTIVSVCGAVLLLGLTAGPGRAEDSDRIRYYLGLRGQDTNPATGTHDAWGVSLGANLGRYWGLEMSADTYERDVDAPGHKIGEYGIGAFVPQLRLRYPLLDDRLVPYLVGGVGLGISQFNDRKPRGFGMSIKKEQSTFLVATAGVGLEWFFADNMAVGFEGKYIAAEDQTIRINGVDRDQQVSGWLTSVALRMFVPELRPAALAEASDAAPFRLYLGVRAGGAFTTDSDAFSNVDVRPEPPAYGGEANQFFGAALGLNIGRHWGAELAIEGYEVRIEDPALGSLSEMAIGMLIPQARFRYPLWNGRVVPYLIAGVGVSYVEHNDVKPGGANVDIDVEEIGLAVAGGLGVDFFVASNIAVGLEARYLSARNHRITTGSTSSDGHFDAVAVALTLRAFLFDFGRSRTR